MKKDALKGLDAMRRLREELARLEQDEDIKKLDSVIKEVREVQIKYKMSDDEFIGILHTAFKKPKAKEVKPIELVKVRVGSKIEEWPSRRSGRLSSDLAKKVAQQMNKTGAKDYEALINLIKV